MKFFKTPLLLLAVACLTLSGTSNENYIENDSETVEMQKQDRLITHCKKKIRLPGNS